jgi:hypothetical protein
LFAVTTAEFLILGRSGAQNAISGRPEDPATPRATDTGTASSSNGGCREARLRATAPTRTSASFLQTHGITRACAFPITDIAIDSGVRDNKTLE